MSEYNNLKEQANELRKLANELDNYIAQDKIKYDFQKRLKVQKIYRENNKLRNIKPLSRTTTRITERDLVKIVKFRELIERSIQIRSFYDKSSLHGTMVTVYQDTLFGKRVVKRYYRIMIEYLIPGLGNQKYPPAIAKWDDEWVYKLQTIKI